MIFERIHCRTMDEAEIELPREGAPLPVATFERLCARGWESRELPVFLAAAVGSPELDGALFQHAGRGRQDRLSHAAVEVLASRWIAGALEPLRPGGPEPGLAQLDGRGAAASPGADGSTP